MGGKLSGLEGYHVVIALWGWFGLGSLCGYRWVGSGFCVWVPVGAHGCIDVIWDMILMGDDCGGGGGNFYARAVCVYVFS